MHKILLVSHQLDYSGAPNALLSSARVMREMGLDVDLLALADGPLELEFRSIGVPRIRDTSFLGYHWIILNTAVSARIAQHIPVQARYCLWIHESPSLFVHSDLPFIVAQAAKRAHGLIFPTESTAADWARFGALRSDSKRILSLLAPVSLPKGLHRLVMEDPRLGLDKMLRLVTIDPLEYFRGHRVIANAIQQLQLMGHDVHYTAVGASQSQTTPLFPMLRSDRIVVTDRVPRDVALRHLAQSHTYVSASTFATQNLGLCEASLLGIPSVVSDIPVHRAWADKMPGSVFTYPLFDDEQLSQIIGLIWRSYAEHSHLGRIRIHVATELLSERRFALALKTFLNS
jgi:glycosyltransferase involved in cell wall biosynthesis